MAKTKKSLLILLTMVFALSIVGAIFTIAPKANDVYAEESKGVLTQVYNDGFELYDGEMELSTALTYCNEITNPTENTCVIYAGERYNYYFNYYYNGEWQNEPSGQDFDEIAGFSNYGTIYAITPEFEGEIKAITEEKEATNFVSGMTFEDAIAYASTLPTLEYVTIIYGKSGENYLHMYSQVNSINMLLDRSETWNDLEGNASGNAIYCICSKSTTTGYAITNNTTDQNGTVSFSATENIEAGTEVTITATPSNVLYAVDAITVTDADGNEVEVANNKFAMPEADVTVVVTFKQVGKLIDYSFWADGKYSLSYPSIVFKNGDKDITEAEAKIVAGELTNVKNNTLVVYAISGTTYNKTYYWLRYETGSGWVNYSGQSNILGQSWRNGNQYTVQGEQPPMYAMSEIFDVINGTSKDAHGTIELSTNRGCYKEYVNITVKPDEGYKLCDLYIKYSSSSYGNINYTKATATATANVYTVQIVVRNNVEIIATFIEENLRPALKKVTSADIESAEAFKNAEHYGYTAITKEEAIALAKKTIINPTSNDIVCYGVLYDDDTRNYNTLEFSSFQETWIGGMDTKENLYSYLSNPNYNVYIIVASSGYNITDNTTDQNGSISFDATEGIEVGTEVTITATPNEGYALYSVSVKDADGNDVTVTDNKFTMPASDVTVVATFKQVIPVIDTTDTTKGSMEFSSDTVFRGVSVTVTATANEGYKFVSWEHSTDNVNYSKVSILNPQKLLYTNVKTYYLRAVFIKISDVIDETTDQNGSISFDKYEDVEAGAEVTITITPNEGYEIDTLVATDANGQEVTITDNKFTMPESDVTVVATFKLTNYYITNGTEEGANGSITISDPADEVNSAYHFGDNVVIVPTANEGYVISTLKYTIDGETYVDIGLEFTMPSSDITIVATFEERTVDTYKISSTDKLIKVAIVGTKPDDIVIKYSDRVKAYITAFEENAPINGMPISNEYIFAMLTTPSSIFYLSGELDPSGNLGYSILDYASLVGDLSSKNIYVITNIDEISTINNDYTEENKADNYDCYITVNENAKVGETVTVNVTLGNEWATVKTMSIKYIDNGGEEQIIPMELVGSLPTLGAINPEGYKATYQFVMPMYEVEIVAKFVQFVDVDLDYNVQTYEYDGISKAFELKTEAGEASTVDGITISYYVQGGTPILESELINVGKYYIVIQRTQDTVSSTDDDSKVYYKKLDRHITDGLEIIPCDITITPADKSVMYDGTEHSLDNASEYVITDTDTGDVKVIGTGDIITIEMTGSITDAGEVETSITSYKITRDGVDITTTNYNITLDTNKLYVTKRAITFTSATDTKMYDGTELTNDTITVSGDGFADGEGATFTVTGTITHVIDNAEKNNTFSYVLNDNTKADNYEIADLVFGTLSITKRAITMTSASDSKVYDGEALTNDTITVTGDGFVDGEGATYTVTGTITHYVDNAENNNAFTYELNEGTDANDYDIAELVIGTLAIEKLSVTVTANDYEKIYDGTNKVPFDEESTPEDVTLSVEYVEGEGFTYTFVGTGIDVGTWEVQIDSITANDGTDENDYDITLANGVLTINKRPITFTSATDTKVYDGAELTNDEITVGGEGFAEGEDAGISYSVTGTATHVHEGEVDNAFTYAFDGVTAKESNYDVTVEFGKLTITVRKITITSADDTKVYDAFELTNDTITETLDEGEGNAFVEGEGATYTVTGTVTHVHEVVANNNIFTYELNTPTLATDYEITIVYGNLVITPAPMTVTTPGAVKFYDTFALTKVKGSSVEGLVNNETIKFEVTGIITNAGAIDNSYEITWTTQEGSTWLTSADYTAYKTDYEITEDLGRLVVDKVLVVVKTEFATKTYDGTALTANGSMTGLVGEETATLTVNGTITDAGEVDNTYTIDWGTTNKDNYEVVELVGKLTVERAIITVETDSASKIYDGTALTAEGSMTGLVDGETATFTVTGTITNAGDVVNDYEIVWGTANENNYEVVEYLGVLSIEKILVKVTTNSASKTYDGTALTAEGSVEIATVDGYTFTVTGTITNAGSVNNTYTLVFDNPEVASNYEVVETIGTLTVTKAIARVTTKSASKVYDATALTATGLVTGLVDGYTFTITGTITNAGLADNTYTLVFDNPEVESNYEVVETIGTLTVTKAIAKVTTNSASKVYDGTPLTATGSVLGVVDSYTFTVVGTIIDAGSEKNLYSLVFDNPEVESNYEVVEVIGTLTITKAIAKVTTNSASKVYDGTALTATGLVTGLVDGYTFTVTGTITNAGSVDNTYTLVFDNPEVASNYEVVETLGTLTISKALVKVTTKSASQTYNASDLVALVGDVTGIVDADAYTFTVTGSIKNVGSIDNTYTLEFANPEVANNYDIVETLGTLTVTKALVKITTNSASKVYDGQALTAEGTVTGVASVPMVGGSGVSIIDTYTFTVTGTITNAGSVDNTYTFAFDNPEVANNYDIIESIGTLTISKALVSVRTSSASKIYDGSALTATGSVKGIVSTDAYTFTVTGTITNVGTVDNNYTLTFANPEVANNYDIVETIGALTVNKAMIKIVTYSASKVYDGADLTADGIIEGIVFGETYTFEPVGAQLNAGSSDNGYVLTFDGTANEDNYFITESIGTLTVTKAVITIETDSASKVYDGTKLTAGGDIYGLVGDETATFEVIGAIINAGIVDNNYKLTFNGTANKDNYIVNSTLGVLVVYKANIVVSNLVMDSFKENKTPSTPTAKTTFGNIIYTYSDRLTGDYVETMPTKPGKYFVKATVLDDENHVGMSIVEGFEIYAKFPAWAMALITIGILAVLTGAGFLIKHAVDKKKKATK